jgi:hypothetical protein
MGFFGSLFGGGASDFNNVIGQASGAETTSMNQGNTLFNQGQNAQAQLSPYFSNLLKDPQGLGATTMSQLMTQAGQTTAGATGAANRTAMDMAARTGNTASVPGAIASANKAGMTNMADTQNNLAIKNTMEKLNQQKEGAEGLSGLFKTDTSSSLDATKNAIAALSPELDATEAQNAAEQKGMSNIMGAATGGLGALSGMIPGMGGAGAGGLGTIASLFA